MGGAAHKTDDLKGQLGFIMLLIIYKIKSQVTDLI